MHCWLACTVPLFFTHRPMAKRLSIDDRVDALAKLRRGPSSPEAVQATIAGLADKSNLVVAKAAVVARELMTTSLVPNLVTALPFHP